MAVGKANKEGLTDEQKQCTIAFTETGLFRTREDVHLIVSVMV